MLNPQDRIHNMTYAELFAMIQEAIQQHLSQEPRSKRKSAREQMGLLDIEPLYLGGWSDKNDLIPREDEDEAL